MMKDSNYQKHADKLLALTKEALHYVEKKDLSRAVMVSKKRKKLISKLKFISVPKDNHEKAKAELKNIQLLNVLIRTTIETELSGLLKRICLIKKELKLRDRFIGPRKISRKIIDGKL